MKDRDLANALRILAVDAVQKASSGHPGMPMGMADIATLLWREFLQHNPRNPRWENRDRFVLSNGHGSMLLYALLYLSGYAMKLEDIRNFRQLDSCTPGHPELEVTGVETTTGPLGQGLANAVGMALAERNLAAEFNRQRLDVISHYTYVFLGDGCLMEGISHEACSFAGVQRLGKLICFFDNNGISIDGEVGNWCQDDVGRRFDSYGWHVIDDLDGHDASILRSAIHEAQKDRRPSLLVCNTSIGHGSPNKANTAAAHGAPLGEEEVALVRQELGWRYPPFEFPQELLQEWNMAVRGEEQERKWNHLRARYERKYPVEWQELSRRLQGRLSSRLAAESKKFIHQLRQENEATRKSSLRVLNALAPMVPELLGGSADLTGSNLTFHNESCAVQADEKGNYIYYGVRELAMSAIMNGIALHGGYIPYGGTFLAFLDYARSAVRLSALMKQRVIYVYTHDSIGVGEDGPTHQPVEHLTILRATPNIFVWRPADAMETMVAWLVALRTKNAPTALVLSRQNLTAQKRTRAQCDAIEKGGYILTDEKNKSDPDIIVIATGSEVEPSRIAVERYNARGGAARLVSMPCCELFVVQSQKYRDAVLPPAVKKRLVVEASASDWWRSFAGLDGDVLGMNGFGKSAPAAVLFKHFGFSAEDIYDRIKKL